MFRYYASPDLGKKGLRPPLVVISVGISSPAGLRLELKPHYEYTQCKCFSARDRPGPVPAFSEVKAEQKPEGCAQLEVALDVVIAAG